MKRRKPLLILLILLAAGVLAVFIPNAVVLCATRSAIVSPETAADFGADCILVLGAGVREDGSPSLMLRERIEAGVNLYRSGAAPKLLMSGDHGTKGYDEVNCMKSEALARDVPAADIFLDHAGFSTYESVYRAQAIFRAKKVVIVTQAYHLPRALYVARVLGLDAVGVACDTQRYFGQLYRDARELLARDKDFVKSLLRLPPTYLGETIDLSGSGEVTDG